MTKNIDLKLVYYALTSAIEGNHLPPDVRTELYRFRDKLADSETFSITVNEAFSKLKLKDEKDHIQECLKVRRRVDLLNGFVLEPESNDFKSSWNLLYDGWIYLDKLDTKLATKIALDINIAFRIKNKRDKQNGNKN